MYQRIRLFLASAAAALAFLCAPAQAQQVFEGDTRLACEALLCLAAPQRPGECVRAITRYFSIKFTNPLKTLTARLNFLQLCPAGDPGFVSALSGGAGFCDAAALNTNSLYASGDGGPIGIDPAMPANCTAYYTHPWLAAANPVPRYVGTPETGGKWVEAADYAAAQAAWEAEQAKKAAEPPAPEGGA
jgi:hypothetical protein